MWVRCGRRVTAAKPLAVVVTAGRGVVANNGGGGDDNIVKCCSCLLSERASQPSATLGSDTNVCRAQQTFQSRLRHVTFSYSNGDHFLANYTSGKVCASVIFPFVCCHVALKWHS